MVLRTDRILSALQQKREAFCSFDASVFAKRDLYAGAMQKLCAWSSLQIAERLADLPWPGALATADWDEHRSWCVPFPLRWNNFEESHAWVHDTIHNVATFAVDGSQIYPSRDISLPVALIQIGWYENRHSADGLFEKDIRVEVLTPAELEANVGGDPKERLVNLRRFQMETERLTEYLQSAAAGRRLAFLDGAIVASFAEPFEPELQDPYVQCLLRLLRASEKHQAPIVAYIDTTYTRDLVSLLRHLFDLPEAPQLHDAYLLREQLNWGDRTPFFVCARSGVPQPILNRYQEMRDRVGFVYLKTNDNLPVRLEMPVWMFEAGWLDWAVDIVRCEAIVGRGYPYVIETADQTALLRTEDRNAFLRILQDWGNRENLSLFRLSRKMVSKLARRRIR